MDDLGVPLFLETPIKIQLVARDLFFSRLSHITATTVLVVWVAPLNHVFVSSDQRHVFLLQKRGWHPTQFYKDYFVSHYTMSTDSAMNQSGFHGMSKPCKSDKPTIKSRIVYPGIVAYETLLEQELFAERKVLQTTVDTRTP